MQFQDVEKNLFKILDGEKDIQSPFDKDGIMKFVFFMVDNESRGGFLWIWCSETYKGIAISRMIIPKDAEYVSSEELSNLRLPTIKFVDHSRNGGGL